jgi:hypothetical protein
MLLKAIGQIGQQLGTTKGCRKAAEKMPKSYWKAPRKFWKSMGKTLGNAQIPAVSQ